MEVPAEDEEEMWEAHKRELGGQYTFLFFIDRLGQRRYSQLKDVPVLAGCVKLSEFVPDGEWWYGKSLRLLDYDIARGNHKKEEKGASYRKLRYVRMRSRPPIFVLSDWLGCKLSRNTMWRSRQFFLLNANFRPSIVGTTSTSPQPSPMNLSTPAHANVSDDEENFTDGGDSEGTESDYEGGGKLDEASKKANHPHLSLVYVRQGHSGDTVCVDLMGRKNPKQYREIKLTKNVRFDIVPNDERKFIIRVGKRKLIFDCCSVNKRNVWLTALHLWYAGGDASSSPKLNRGSLLSFPVQLAKKGWTHAYRAKDRPAVFTSLTPKHKKKAEEEEVDFAKKDAVAPPAQILVVDLLLHPTLKSYGLRISERGGAGAIVIEQVAPHAKDAATNRSPSLFPGDRIMGVNGEALVDTKNAMRMFKYVVGLQRSTLSLSYVSGYAPPLSPAMLSEEGWRNNLVVSDLDEEEYHEDHEEDGDEEEDTNSFASSASERKHAHSDDEEEEEDENEESAARWISQLDDKVCEGVRDKKELVKAIAHVLSENFRNKTAASFHAIAELVQVQLKEWHGEEASVAACVKAVLDYAVARGGVQLVGYEEATSSPIGVVTRLKLEEEDGGS